VLYSTFQIGKFKLFRSFDQFLVSRKIGFFLFKRLLVHRLSCFFDLFIGLSKPLSKVIGHRFGVFILQLIFLIKLEGNVFEGHRFRSEVQQNAEVIFESVDPLTDDL